MVFLLVGIWLVFLILGLGLFTAGKRADERASAWAASDRTVVSHPEIYSGSDAAHGEAGYEWYDRPVPVGRPLDLRSEDERERDELPDFYDPELGY